MTTLLHDLRYGLRTLSRSPGFTAIAIITLAVGIGANAAIFSMVNGILLRSLPYQQPQQLYTINESVPQWSRFFGTSSFPANSGNFFLWRRRTTAFSGMAEFRAETFSLTGIGRPRQLHGAVILSGLFSVLGIEPQLGRTFLPEENQRGHDNEAILTHQLAEQLFGANSHILGKAIDLNGISHTIVGVLPANFRFPKLLADTPQIFKPFALGDYDSGAQASLGEFNFTVIARLKRGVSPKQALAQINVIEAQIAKKDSSGFSLYAIMQPLKTVIVGPVESALWMLVAAAAVVLLIICVNLANLMLVRNTGRAREVAVRSALGATPKRLARQLLTEAFILAAAGGGLGLLVASWGLDLLVRNAPVGIPRVNGIRIDPRVLWFTLAISIIAAFIFALLPALRLARVAPAEALKSAGPTISGGKSSARLRSGLVMGEIALCGVLLAGALLLIQSLAHVAKANQWMDEQHVITVDLKAPPNEYPTSSQMAQFYSNIVQKVRDLPGVKSAGFVSALPLTGAYWGDEIDFREAPQPPAKVNGGEFGFISPGYFQTIGLPLIKGRLLSESDRGEDVALISESVARRVLHGRNPIGMHLIWRKTARRIIGVVANIREAPDKPPNLGVYLPIWSHARPEETLVVRTSMDPRSAASSIRRAIWSVDPQVAIPREETLKTLVRTSVAPRRYETTLGSLFALVAVLLAALGLYGVISYSVSQRTHEIGVRMALGAQKGDVLKMVIASGIKLALIGVAIAIALALALDRLLAGMLFGVKPDDPGTLVGVAIVLIVVALLACYIPARRATKVDPMVALRYE
jgi:predicted permease